MKNRILSREERIKLADAADRYYEAVFLPAMRRLGKKVPKKVQEASPEGKEFLRLQSLANGQ